MKTYQVIARLVKYRPGIFTLYTLIPISFYSGGSLAFGLILQALFNTMTKPAHQYWLLLEFLLLLFIVTVARSVIMYTLTYFTLPWLFQVVALLQRNILRYILKNPEAFAAIGSSSNLLSYFRDDTELIAAILGAITGTLSLFIFAIPTIVILLHISVLITLLVFFPLLSILALAQFMQKYLEKYRMSSRDATVKLIGTLSEIFSSVQSIQVFQKEISVLRHLQHLNEKRRVQMQKDIVLSNVLDSVFGNAVNLGTGLILILAALYEHLKPGDIAIFIAYLGTVGGIIQGVASFFTQYMLTKVSVDRLAALLPKESVESLVSYDSLHLDQDALSSNYFAKKAGNEEALNILDVRHITCHYPGTTHGVEDISFCLKKGSVTVVTGRIASGKTTLLKALLGLIPLEKGEIYWKGEVVTNPANFFIPPRSAYTPQEPHLFDGTLKENILLGLNEQPEELQRAIWASVLDEDIKILHDGLSTQIGTQGMKLSGGQILRVAAARMLIRNTDIVIIDDFSSAIDVKTEQKFWQRVLSQYKSTFLIVSHRRQVLQMAENIILLRKGKMEAMGKLNELLQFSEEMQQIWEGNLADNTE